MRIDLHSHIIPPRYLEETRDIIVASTPRPQVVLNWTPDSALAGMDAAGVRTAVTSISVPGLWFGDREQTRRLSKECNDFAADLVAGHPDRFGMFAMLPLPDVDASLLELERALDVFGADGVGLFTNYGTAWLSDPAFAPVLAELNARRALAFVHPIAPTACAWMAGLRPSAVEYLFDTARCITSIIFTGTAKAYPDIRWVFCHSGGALVAMFDRIVRQANHDEGVRAIIPEGPMPYLRAFHYEIAASASSDTLGALTRHIPISQILFGLDSPFISASSTLDNFSRMELTPAERAAIEHKNAQRLIPRLASASPC